MAAITNITDQKKWRILELLSWTTSYFKSNKIESPRASAEILLASALNLKRIDLYINYDKPLLASELAVFKKLIVRRKKREPAAYIIGTKEFWSMSFEVTKDVLIPRPDTEILVETAIEVIKRKKESENRTSLRILELGVGSGAVISAIASNQQGNEYFGIDKSEQALMIAKRNAEKHNLNIFFFLSDWFRAVPQMEDMRFDIIVSNPPYIKSDEIKKLSPEINLYEPKTALDGGADGLDAIRHIIYNAERYLKEEGSLLLEIGFDQRESVLEIAEQTNKYKDIKFFKDYGGNYRVVSMIKMG